MIHVRYANETDEPIVIDEWLNEEDHGEGHGRIEVGAGESWLTPSYAEDVHKVMIAAGLKAYNSEGKRLRRPRAEPEPTGEMLAPPDRSWAGWAPGQIADA